MVLERTTGNQDNCAGEDQQRFIAILCYAMPLPCHFGFWAHLESYVWSFGFNGNQPGSIRSYTMNMNKIRPTVQALCVCVCIYIYLNTDMGGKKHLIVLRGSENM
jgi:hypothetical protein